MGETCYKCHQPNGKGPRELRPYGPGGAWLCAECMFSDPKEEEGARQRFAAQLNAADRRTRRALLTSSGPVPLGSKEDLDG